MSLNEHYPEQRMLNSGPLNIQGQSTVPKLKSSLFTKVSKTLGRAVTLHRETVPALTQHLQEDEQHTLSMYMFVYHF